MAILDSIKEGLASLESGMKDTAREATNTSGLRGSAVHKEKMKDWSRSKEGVALIDVALSVGLEGVEMATKSVNTAEAFINDSYEKKDELMDLGRKIVDKKSYEAGEKALDMAAEVEDFVKKNSKKFEKSIEKAASTTSESASEAGESALDTLKKAKESSEQFTSNLVKEVADKAEDFKKDLSDQYDVQVSAIDMMLERSGNDTAMVMDDLKNLGMKSAEELKAIGVIKIEAYTRTDGGKIPTHFRKRAR
tara:strand:- start:9449 stop:10198 length:750 start_codon:yes stop_codon:yes gene_type:complete